MYSSEDLVPDRRARWAFRARAAAVKADRESGSAQPTRTRLCAVAIALCGIAVTGCLTPQNLETGDADLRAIVTIEDFAGWLEANSIVLTPEAEALSKRKVAWSYELSYEFSGVEAGPGTEPLRVFVRSEVMVHPNASSALHNANSYWAGLKAGLWKSGATLEPSESTLEWGDGADCYEIHKEGNQIGNLFIGHSGAIATYVIVSGLYSSDPALFEALLEPKLRELEHYDPVPATRDAADRG